MSDKAVDSGIMFLLVVIVVALREIVRLRLELGRIEASFEDDLFIAELEGELD